MIGLALQGGGARGSYQIGAYLALKKHHIKFDGVCGTSIGAFNGAMIASGREQELLNFWKTISVAEILGFNEEYANKIKDKKHDLNYYFLGLKHVLKIIKSRGISVEGLEKVLKTNLNISELMNSNMDYGLCTVRVHDLKPLYIFKESMNTEKLYDYILASCYLPFFKMEKKVDDHYYIDGGFYDNTPINMLIDKGYKKIYVVELNPLINRNQKLKKEVEIVKITPRRKLGGVLTFDNDIINENIKMGYFDALRVLKKLDGYDYCFKRNPEFIYTFLTRKISKKRMERIMSFFNVRTKKLAVIKSIEYVMKKEKLDYYQIYKPLKTIKKIKKMPLKEHFVYDFVQDLKGMF